MDVYTQECAICGTEFVVKQSDALKAERRGYAPPRFCSMSCRNVSYVGEGNPKWRGGRITNGQGYIRILRRDHPFADHHGYVLEHRLVMESVLGRYLTPIEEVHHINEVKDDNRSENLKLMADAAAHRVEHAHYEDQPCAHCGVAVTRSLGHRRRWSRAFCSRVCAAAVASEVAAIRAAERRAA